MSLDSFPAGHVRPISALAFDYGTQRIGVAYGQSISGTATSVCVLRARDGIPEWNQVAALIDDWNPDVFIVGLPFNLDGTDSELVACATRFGNRLTGRFSLPCFGMDERLSTREAIQRVVEETGGSYKRSAIDHIAAQIILENWFSEYTALAMHNQEQSELGNRV